MRTKLSILLTITMILAMIPMSAFALEPVDPNEQMMYADDVEFADALSINISSYTGYHHLRLDPTNALGEFDAIQSAGQIANDYFFGLAARVWTEYTFEERFCNVDWETDIQFAEVTWGTANGWHPEAAKVYLTGAMVDGELETEPYYVGIVWNRIGVNYISAADRLTIAEGYSPELGRALATSELQTEGVIEITGFNLPAQVESAAGVRLIDITEDIFDFQTTSPVNVSTYTNGAGGRFTVNSLPLVYPNDGAVTIQDINPSGNTDGFDLDAIRVWKCPPMEEEYGFCGYKLDAETGLGLEGWTINLLDEDGIFIKDTETDENGRYCFENLPAGTYKVEEVTKVGWEQVFPGGSGIHEITLPVALNLIDNGDFEQGNTGFGSDYDLVTVEGTTGAGDSNLGTLDREGAYAIGKDPALYHQLWSSFKDHTSGDGNMMIVNGSTETDVSVWFTTTDIIPGTDYTFSFWSRSSYNMAIAEVDVWINGEYQDTFTGPINSWAEHSLYWNSGTATSAEIEFICNTSVYDGTDFALDDISLIGQPSYNFVNQENLFDIAGYKLDGDTEEGLEGWTINLYSWDEIAHWVLYATDVTDEDGKYCFEGLEAGEYKVEEVMEDGWIQLEPENDVHMVTLPEGASNCAEEINLYDFVNAELFDLCGFKYGVNWLDPGSMENPLEGWTITLLDSDREFVADTTTTDEYGKYCFEGLRKGTYFVVESHGSMNGNGFWENDNYWKPVDSDTIEVEIPRDATIDEEGPFTDFYNMCYTDETAWMFGDIEHNSLDGLTSNNWGWSLELKDVGDLVLDEPRELLDGIEIYAAAGQNDLDKGYLAGYLDICWDGENVVICNVEAEDWTTLEGMKVWVGNTKLPKTKKGAYTNAPGQLVTQEGIDYTKTVYVAVHFESFAPCEFRNIE